MAFLIALGIILGGCHLVYWLITKGVIFVMWALFQVNWYGKFWAVYLFLIIIGLIFRAFKGINKGE